MKGSHLPLARIRGKRVRAIGENMASRTFILWVEGESEKRTNKNFFVQKKRTRRAEVDPGGMRRRERLSSVWERKEGAVEFSERGFLFLFERIRSPREKNKGMWGCLQSPEGMSRASIARDYFLLLGEERGRDSASEG